MPKDTEILGIGTHNRDKRALITQAIIDAGLPMDRVLFESPYESLHSQNPMRAALEKAGGTIHEKSLATDVMRAYRGVYIGKADLNGTYNHEDPLTSECLHPWKNREVIMHHVETVLINGKAVHASAFVDFRLRTPSVLDLSHLSPNVPLGVRIDKIGLHEIEILNTSRNVTTQADIEGMFLGVNLRDIKKMAEMALGS